MTRYTPGYETDESSYGLRLVMDPDENGDWVRYSDHQAAITRTRQETIEEAAKIADQYPGVYGNSPTAAAIRALQHTGEDGETKV